MRTQPLVAGALLALALSTSATAQQTPVVTSRELDAALESRGRSVEADRTVVRRVLSRADVKAAAEAHGFSDRLEDARSAAGGLSGERLTRAAGYARNIELQLAGGQNVTFSATTLIILLLLVIIIILVVD